MIKELSDEYMPERILFRDEEITKVEDVFKKFKKWGMANNILIRGVTGCGKTTIIKNIITKQDNHLYVSCADTKTPMNTLNRLLGSKHKHISEVLESAIQKLKDDKKILIIDEVNKCNNTIELFDDLNTIYRATTCPIIIITNRWTLLEEINEDARKTLFFDKINFSSYNSTELFEILKDRLSIAPDLPKVPMNILKYICAVGTREGSARVVLSMASKCITANNFTQEYVERIKQDMDQEDFREMVYKLNQTQKKFLKVILGLYSSKGNIMTRDIIQQTPELSPARISQLVTYFMDEYGIITKEWKNKGRGGGRFRIIKFITEDVFKKLDRIMET